MRVVRLASSVHTARTRPLATTWSSTTTSALAASRSLPSGATGTRTATWKSRVSSPHAPVGISMISGEMRVAVGCEVEDLGRDLANEQDLAALRRPHAQHRLGHAAAHRRPHHRLEVGLELRRLGDDVDGAEQGRGDPPQLVDRPVIADATAVALELSGELGECVGQDVRGSPSILPSVRRMA